MMGCVRALGPTHVYAWLLIALMAAACALGVYLGPTFMDAIVVAWLTLGPVAYFSLTYAFVRAPTLLSAQLLLRTPRTNMLPRALGVVIALCLAPIWALSLSLSAVDTQTAIVSCLLISIHLIALSLVGPWLLALFPVAYLLVLLINILPNSPVSRDQVAAALSAYVTMPAPYVLVGGIVLLLVGLSLQRRRWCEARTAVQTLHSAPTTNEADAQAEYWQRLAEHSDRQLRSQVAQSRRSLANKDVIGLFLPPDSRGGHDAYFWAGLALLILFGFWFAQGPSSLLPVAAVQLSIVCLIWMGGPLGGLGTLSTAASTHTTVLMVPGLARGTALLHATLRRMLQHLGSQIGKFGPAAALVLLTCCTLRALATPDALLIAASGLLLSTSAAVVGTLLWYRFGWTEAGLGLATLLVLAALLLPPILCWSWQTVQPIAVVVFVSAAGLLLYCLRDRGRRLVHFAKDSNNAATATV